MSEHERRVQETRVDYRFLNKLSKRLGHQGGWNLAGGINLEVIAWIIRYVVETDILPRDAIPTWVWHDPSRGSVCVLIWSKEFPVVEEGACAPTTSIMVEQDDLDEAADQYRKLRYAVPHNPIEPCEYCGVVHDVDCQDSRSQCEPDAEIDVLLKECRGQPEIGDVQLKGQIGQ